MAALSRIILLRNDIPQKKIRLFVKFWVNNAQKNVNEINKNSKLLIS